jgi:putative FmdB family regulatory protein
MPLHDFRCPKCGKTFTELKGINDPIRARCECGAEGKKLWTDGAKAVVFFREGFDVSLGQYFSTEREYRNYIRENGYTRL